MPGFSRLMLVLLGISCVVGCANQKSTEKAKPAESATMAPRPMVMLGVRMAPAGPAMAKHMGVHPEDATLITFVGADTPASKAGMEDWDIVIGMNGSSKASPAAIRRVLRTANPGDRVRFTLNRGGEEVDVTVILEPAAQDRMIPLPG